MCVYVCALCVCVCVLCACVHVYVCRSIKLWVATSTDNLIYPNLHGQGFRTIKYFLIKEPVLELPLVFKIYDHYTMQ